MLVKDRNTQEKANKHRRREIEGKERVEERKGKSALPYGLLESLT